MSAQSQAIVKAVQSVVSRPAALHKPSFGGNELTLINECIESAMVSAGAFVDRFEVGLQSYTKALRAVAVSSGTCALQIALKVIGVRRDDEVLVPALTFSATAAAVVHCDAVPHFVDSEWRTLGMDPAALRAYLSHRCEIIGGQCVNMQTGRTVRAIVPVHVFGHPCDMQGIVEVARDFNLIIVEDAAESLGSYIGTRHTGTFGLLGTLSFNGNKTITTGGGGAILTNDFELADRVKHLITTAKVPHRWNYVHDEVGYNFRMPDVNAALGCAQLEMLPSILESQRVLFTRYESAFDGLPVRMFKEPQNCMSNYWLQALVLDESVENERDAILSELNDTGVTARPAWTLLNKLEPYRNCPRAPLPVAEQIERRVINLPSGADV